MPKSIFQLVILTPEEKFFDGEISQAVLPGAKGSFGVLKNHAPFVSPIDKGVVALEDVDGRESRYSIKQGFFEVANNKALLLTDSIAKL